MKKSQKIWYEIYGKDKFKIDTLSYAMCQKDETPVEAVKRSLEGNNNLDCINYQLLGYEPDRKCQHWQMTFGRYQKDSWSNKTTVASVEAEIIVIVPVLKGYDDDYI